MKAIVLSAVGGVEALELRDVPDPVAGPGEVVVLLERAALNHRDVWIRKGMYAGMKLPAILGSDGFGRVESVGPGVAPSLEGRSVVIGPGLDWGDDQRIPGPKFRVLGMPDDGTYARKIKTPASNVFDAPPNLSPGEAAALPLAGLTAYRALATRAQLKAGETLLITGIGGGVSAIALPIARAMGARVFVTSGSDEKLATASAMGAEGGVNYRSGDWTKAALSLIGNEGPDVILDSVGGETFSRALGVVRRGGRIVTYGATTGPADKYEITRLFWKQIDVLGTTMGSPKEFAELLKLVGDHDIRPAVDRTFPLAEAAEAHRRMEEAGQFGKILLDVTS